MPSLDIMKLKNQPKFGGVGISPLLHRILVCVIVNEPIKYDIHALLCSWKISKCYLTR